MTDIHGPQVLTIRIDETGHIVWVDTKYECVLRAANVKQVVLHDCRSKVAAIDPYVLRGYVVAERVRIGAAMKRASCSVGCSLYQLNGQAEALDRLVAFFKLDELKEDK